MSSWQLKRLNIIVGALGSGKTELAINLALYLAARKPTAIVDLDIINPYYRTRYTKDKLEKMGLEVICPPHGIMQADIPALPASILGVITGEDRYGVFDVGGDDIGATVLGRFKTFLPSGQYAVFFIINTCRPAMGTPENIITMLNGIERASRVKVTYLVNNTNLGSATDVATVASGYQVVAEVSRQTGIPVAFTAAHEELQEEVAGLDLGTPVFLLHRFMRPPWDEE
ncbi:MAG: hypothetical protein H0Z39_00670 [Peptococcaceae bacterium]|nr:hypothetical protein [Peptococcaceae bacterium]